jgi:hypothetical protein
MSGRCGDSRIGVVEYSVSISQIEVACLFCIRDLTLVDVEIGCT